MMSYRSGLCCNSTMPVGHIAAVGGARRGREIGKKINASGKIKAAAEARAMVVKQQKLAADLIQAYDHDQSGTLDRSELPPMLRDIAERVYAADGHLPSESDVRFLIVLCDRQVEDGEAGDGLIDRAEVLDVCQIWADFIEQRATIQTLINKYSHHFEGALTEEELHTLLLEVDGQDVPSEVVRWIFKTADVTQKGSLSGIELARAICALKMWRREDRLRNGRFKRASLYSNLRVPTGLPRRKERTASVSCTVL
eukprot:TRINITY_DN30665_c0_g1_i1.p1 TRINITY_DN30665_c0_g1~~TRINITY_DN30665_c0_g1_i1.p1  ORF type:complete len:254 (+),score=55.39 TRINITY_DN30665_c0_g1_i1:16-777(+)